MRIISQDGTLDIPYEQVIVQRFKEKIYVLNKNLTGVVKLCDDMQIDKYSTEEKAKKSMEELKSAYICHNYFNLGKALPNGIDEKLIFGFTGVFKFPAEEELE